MLAARGLVSRRLVRHSSTLTYNRYPFLAELGLGEDNLGVYTGKWQAKGPVITQLNPATNEPIARVTTGNYADFQECMSSMDRIKQEWGALPLPTRGEIVRKIGEKLREKKSALGSLVTLEMGKIASEGQGEIQEAIDICDYATGLSRTLSGSVLPSERPGHFMMERWNPLNGHVAIITAFNFPAAVFFWNAAISLVCGNTQIWKGASSTSLVTIACQKIVAEVMEKEGFGSAATMIQGSGKGIGDPMVADRRNNMVSFTGSTGVGKGVARTVSERFGRTILELGGNNACIVMNDANLDLALRAVLFGAVGTAGQRCTSTRRLYLQEGIYDKFIASLTKAYKSVVIGDPLDPKTLCGPLHTRAAVKEFTEGVKTAVEQGGKILAGGRVVSRPGNFVEPTIIALPNDAPCIQDELFVPVLYVMKTKNLAEAIALNNNVPQGLSSSLFTTNQQDVFKWTGPAGSDCGIVNVNIGNSGAEIGGAFGGEKETGGGREAGSDSWKQYMKRSTCTVNYTDKLPLAQGVNFTF